MMLQDAVIRSAQERPDDPALVLEGETYSYAWLDGLANQFARVLADVGVVKGDRVGVWLDKSPYSVAAMQGALRLGAAYVPMDPLSPAERARLIVEDCGVRAIFSDAQRLTALAEADPAGTTTIAIDGQSTGDLGWGDVVRRSAEPLPEPEPDPDRLAYVLYTSGSTGRPKGVCISHRNALAFVEWAARTFEVHPGDRLANHAPFHFDLSVFDLYGAFLSGATCVLIPDTVSYSGERLVDLLINERITIWYSVPSALVLMMDNGDMIRRVREADAPLRMVLYAGEPFSAPQTRRLREGLPRAVMYNLYGPIETNVCAHYRVEHVPEDRTTPLPIGRAASGDRIWAERDDGQEAAVGEEGELLVAGPTVMLGYWGYPAQGDAPYRTGDLVRRIDEHNYELIGRKDDMVKVRGRRVEPGEIEAALYQIPAIKECAVVAVGSGVEARLVGFIVLEPGRERPSILEIKRKLSERLPTYMILDYVREVEEIPKNRNGKVDRRRLQETLQETA